ncbi:hypothetical protein TVAG_124930 [Trichomonas vaginalis G3]|uniref:Uncharacterized protein n=1 Tax=Trichomonas vaginalis (strain ATCC PRA-98 / G3) TaxID=412133 RepID=A2EIJ9_TRIV3|nr:hypothetical protein TVAGG3_0199790 [Trichomonas vaginalis G3]EAY07520.1 hypothetical protein TVAG_124930 [Trichomonas vaginalis G3]KAI5550526.1 hypothetical protein TVAGG3_0199790 [Trichomonas vaginalis G3]|eukprot:XP_001319743.1 hypothetical protein [Trichomonas vaginalis G3]
MSTSQDMDYATLFFNHLQMENEIHEVWREMKLIREDPSLPDCIKFSLLQKLFEVHNALDLESTREQENYMSSFLQELRLPELGVRPMTEGKLKVHIMQHMSRRANPNPRSLSFGFIDPGVQVEKRHNTTVLPSSNSGSGILLRRKSEIEFELRSMQMKGKLTPEESEEKLKLTRELSDIMKV